MNIAFINERKHALSLTNQQIAEQANITLSSLDKITSGRNTNPKLSTVKALARVLKCSIDDFVDTEAAQFTGKEVEIIEKYRMLDEHGRYVVTVILDAEYDRCKNNGQPKFTHDPAARKKLLNDYVDNVQPVSHGPSPSKDAVKP